MEAWLFESIEWQRAAIVERRLSASSLVAATLARIERLEPALHAFITVTGSSAAHEATELDASRGRSAPYPRQLQGIPFGVKDNIDAAGWPTTAASGFLRSNVATADAAVVERLRAAGAVLVGKLNMHEFASGVTSVSEEFGTVTNPYDPARIPGGSSSGSAVAVAAGQVTFAIGTDTGGSIRIPAALCGIVGLKPTTGRVPTGGILPWSWVLDHAGPMTRTVRDAAIVLGAIAGYDASDVASVDHPVDDYLAGIEGGIDGLRLGFARSAMTGAEPRVASEVERAIAALGRGATVDDADWPEVDASVDVHRVIVDADLAAHQHERFVTTPEGYSPDLRARIERGHGRAATELAQARRAQLEMIRSIDRRFEAVDALILPTVPIVAPLRTGLDGAKAAESLSSLVRPFSVFGTPAISVPIGDVGGLPVGLQIVTARWTEAKLLRIARAVERAVDVRRPPFAG